MDTSSIYLNTAGTGLISREAIDAAQAFLEEAAFNPTLPFHRWMEEDLPLLRKDTAQLLGTKEDQISFLPNFSFALSSVLQSVSGKLEKVLLYDEDYPSVNMPFEVGNFEVHYIKSKDGFHLPAESVIRKIKEQDIDLVALSHVQYLTGYKVDIQRIGSFCQENNIVFIVDATQSIGATPINFDRMPADVLISSSYKWLNGGLGSAILCIKDRFLTEFPPAVAGFGSLDKSDMDHWKYTPSHLSYEPGHMNPTGLLQLHEGIKQKLRDGLGNIHKHNTALVRQLHNGLIHTRFQITGENDLDNRLHILIFRAEKAVADQLREKGVSITWRKNTIRVSPHYYNTKEQIEAFLSIIRGIS